MTSSIYANRAFLDWTGCETLADFSQARRARRAVHRAGSRALEPGRARSGVAHRNVGCRHEGRSRDACSLCPGRAPPQWRWCCAIAGRDASGESLRAVDAEIARAAGDPRHRRRRRRSCSMPGTHPVTPTQPPTACSATTGELCSAARSTICSRPKASGSPGIISTCCARRDAAGSDDGRELIGKRAKGGLVPLIVTHRRALPSEPAEILSPCSAT